MRKFTLALILAAVSAAAQEKGNKPKISAELAAKDPATRVNVIVQWAHKPTDSTHQKIVSRGGAIHWHYSTINAGAYSIPASALHDLAADPEVSYIALDRPVHPNLDYTAAAVNAPAAWSAGLTGSGIGVAVIDSGVNPNVDFRWATRIVYSQDFTTPPSPPAAQTSTSTSSSLTSNSSGTSVSSSSASSYTLTAPDLFGHGEHVAGIIAGDGALSSCANCDRLLKGIAPSANLINLRVLDQNGAGTDSQVIAAIDTAISLAPKYNIRVINLSLGRPVYESYQNDPLCQAVEQAWKAGIVVVVAAGNEGRDNSFNNNGYGTIEAPGNDPFVITVGAMKTEATYTRTDDLIASYSSKGPTLIDGVVKPDLVAPGNMVVSLLASTTATLAVRYPGNITAKGYYENGNSPKPANTFFQLSGTSMATPVVSGAAALLLQSNPAMTPDQVKARLMLTAYKTFPTSSVASDSVTGMTYVSYYDIFTVGAGYLDIAAALANTTLAQGTAISPTAVYDASTGSVGLTTDPSSVWNLNGVWGIQSVFDLRTVWGAGTINAARTVWGAGAVFSSNTVAAERTVWGAGVNLSGPTAQCLSPVMPPASGSVTSTSTAIALTGEN